MLTTLDDGRSLNTDTQDEETFNGFGISQPFCAQDFTALDENYTGLVAANTDRDGVALLNSTVCPDMSDPSEPNVHVAGQQGKVGGCARR